MTTRRSFIASAAAAGTITVLPFRARAEAHMANSFATERGEIIVHPVQHASVVLETPSGVIYADPVGGAAMYEGLPPPDLILVTHEHGDHYDAETLAALPAAPIVTNRVVHDMLPEELKARATAIGNGEAAEAIGITVNAIPAYNITEGRLEYHPEGRDNGYVMTIDGFTIYISGDTEDIPEMRALEGVDLAFVSMVLPYTMDATQAASAVSEFAPTYVYPYHYSAGGDGDQDPEAFASMVTSDTEVRLGDWYGQGDTDGA